MKKILAVVLLAIVAFVPGVSGAQPLTPQVTQVPTVNQAPPQPSLQYRFDKTLYPGWNLVGNVFDGAIPVVGVFGSMDTGNNTTPLTQGVKAVWKWSNATSRWQFYSPQLTTTASAEYAQKNGYENLQWIGPGEAFWVQATATVVMTEVGASSDGIIAGWLDQTSSDGWKMLTATSPTLDDTWSWWSAENISNTLAQMPPNPQSIAGLGVVETLWKWNRDAGSWSFYSPIMTATLGSAYVDNFVYANGFRKWWTGETVQKGDAFWVNIVHRDMPTQVAPQLPQINSGGKG